ncbi:MAG: SLC13 family permease [Gammaproteobacteria bacterium]|nr:SLC13 family permease [Gammaproteobacteria bacterium]
MQILRFAYSRLTEDLLLLALLIGFVLLASFTAIEWRQLPALVDWHTIAILAGLMVLSRGLEDSGALVRSGYWLLGRMHSERQLALAMVLFAALLSAVITNDVALFIVVPLTLSLGRLASLPVGRMIIFQALAVNAGSAVSPVGNPQNLYLWQRSGDSFVAFMAQMLPIASWMLVGLLLMTALAFSARRVGFHTHTARQPVDLHADVRQSGSVGPVALYAASGGCFAGPAGRGYRRCSGALASHFQCPGDHLSGRIF